MKQRKLFVSLLVVMALVFALTGCFLKEEDTIEMVNAPKVDYTQIAEGEDSLAQLSFTVKVKQAGKEYVLTYAGKDDDNLTVTGFDLTKVGTRTATVTYKKTSLEITFTYTVTSAASDVLNGTGTEVDPYQLSSPQDFQLLVEKYNSSEVFALTQDIDFSDFDIETYVSTMVDKDFNVTGTFDGKGYTISNLTVPGLDGEDGEQTQTGLFYRIAPAAGQTVTFKDVKFSNCSITNSSAAGAGLLGQGGYADDTAKGTVIVNNVDMYGCNVQAMKNSSLYIGYAAGKNFQFINCDVDANSSVMTTGHSSATFIGSGSYIDYLVDETGKALKGAGSVVFDNCVSSAKLIGASNVHGFLGNYSTSEDYTAERKNGSKFTGTIYTLTAASDSSSILPNVANTSLDNYKIYCAGDVATGTGFTASKSIQPVTLTYTAGAALSIPKVTNGVSYVFAYSFARGGSTYGNSETVTVVNGDTVSASKIKYFNQIYDRANDETYTDAERNDANGLCIYGALSELKSTSYSPYYVTEEDYTNKTNPVYRATVTFSVMVFDDEGNLIACGKVERKTTNVEKQHYIDTTKDNGIPVSWEI